MARWTNTLARSRAWELDENEARPLPRGRGVVVRVDRGTALVTQEGDREDHVLEPGDELVLRRRGRAVVWAFTAATISLPPPASRSIARVTRLDSRLPPPSTR